MGRVRVVDGAVVVATLALVCVLPLSWLLLGAVQLTASWFVLRAFCASPLDLRLVLADLGIAIAQFVAKMATNRAKPRFPEWTIALELIQRVGKRLLTRYGANLALPANAKHARSLTNLSGAVEGWVSCQAAGTILKPILINGLEHLWLRPKSPPSLESKRYVVLFYHGGGYTILSPRLYTTVANRTRAAILAAYTKLKSTEPIDVHVFLANYRKAPEFQFPVPQQDAVRMFEYLRDVEQVPPHRIILMGDSAGGGLALSTLLRLRDEKKATLPLASVLLYPLADLADDANPARGQHCVLSREFIRASTQALLPTCDDPSTWKDASAAHCDLSGLPPALIQVGSADFLYQDSVKLFNKAKRDGVSDWQLDVLPNLPHIFSALPASVVPETEPAFARIGEFIATQIVARN